VRLLNTMDTEKLWECKQAVAGMDDNMSLSDYIFVISNGNEVTDDHMQQLKADLRYDAGLDEADVDSFLAHIRQSASGPMVDVLKEELNIGPDPSLGELGF